MSRNAFILLTLLIIILILPLTPKNMHHSNADLSTPKATHVQTTLSDLTPYQNEHVTLTTKIDTLSPGFLSNAWINYSYVELQDSFDQDPSTSTINATYIALRYRPSLTQSFTGFSLLIKKPQSLTPTQTFTWKIAQGLGTAMESPDISGTITGNEIMQASNADYVRLVFMNYKPQVSSSQSFLLKNFVYYYFALESNNGVPLEYAISDDNLGTDDNQVFIYNNATSTWEEQTSIDLRGNILRVTPITSTNIDPSTQLASTTIQASLVGDFFLLTYLDDSINYFYSSYSLTPFTVLDKTQPVLSLNNITAEYESTITLEALITNNSLPLNNELIEFYIYYNNEWKYLGKQYTNINGIAQLALILLYHENTTIKARLQQDPTITDLATLTVTPARIHTTSVSITSTYGVYPQPVSTQVTIQIQFLNQQNNPISNLTVDIYLNNSLQATSATNQTGYIHTSFPTTLEPGEYLGILQIRAWKQGFIPYQSYHDLLVEKGSPLFLVTPTVITGTYENQTRSLLITVTTNGCDPISQLPVSLRETNSSSILATQTTDSNGIANLTLPVLPSGTMNLLLETQETPFFKKSNYTIYSDLNKTQTILSLTNSPPNSVYNVTYYDYLSITGVLYTQNAPLSNQTVELWLYKTLESTGNSLQLLGTTQTRTNGSFTFTWQLTDQSLLYGNKYRFYVLFNSSMNYSLARTDAFLSPLPMQTILQQSGVYTFVYQTPITLSTKLLTEKNDPLPGKTLIARLQNGTILYSLTDSNGIASFQIGIVPVGTYDLTVEFLPDIIYPYNKTQSTFTYVVYKASTLITTPSIINVTQGDTFIGTYQLINAETRKPLSNQKMELWIYNATFSTYYYSTTNTTGYATFPILITLSLGNYTFTLHFAGNSNYQETTNTTTFHVMNIKTILHVNGPLTFEYNNSNQLSIHLATWNNQSLSNQEITLFLNNKTYQGVTNLFGIAVITIHEIPGTYVASYYYNGSMTLQAANITTILTIEKQYYTITIMTPQNTLYSGATISFMFYVSHGDSGIANVSLSLFMNGTQYTIITNQTGYAIIPVFIDMPGQYLILVQANESLYYYYYETSNTYTIQAPSLQFQDLSIPNTTYGTSTQITGTLLDPNNGNTTGAIIKLYYYDPLSSTYVYVNQSVVNAQGEFMFTWLPPTSFITSSNMMLHLYFTGEKIGYYTGKINGTLLILPAPTTILVNSPNTWTYNQTISINGSVQATTGFIESGNITLLIQTTNTTITVTLNHAFTIPLSLEEGEYIIILRFEGSLLYNQSSMTFPLIVHPLEITPILSNITANQGETVTPTIQLQNNQNYVLTNGSILLTITNETYSRTITYNVSANTLNAFFLVRESPGTYNVTVQYIYNHNFNGTKTTITLQVTSILIQFQHTQITGTIHENITLTGQLTSLLGIPINGLTIQIIIQNTTYTVVTGDNGYFALVLTNDWQNSTYDIIMLVEQQSSYHSLQQYFHLNMKKATYTITYSPITTLIVNLPSTFNTTILSPLHQPLSNVSISFTSSNGTMFQAITNDAGQVSITLLYSTVGTYTLTIYIPATTDYESYSMTLSFNVTYIMLHHELVSYQASYNAPLQLTGHVSSNSIPIENVTVTIVFLNQTYVTLTNATGYYQFTSPDNILLSPGNALFITILFTHELSDVQTQNFQLLITKHPVLVQLERTTFLYGENITLIGIVTTQYHEPIQGLTIRIEDGIITYTAVTNQQGMFRIVLPSLTNQSEFLLSLLENPYYSFTPQYHTITIKKASPLAATSYLVEHDNYYLKITYTYNTSLQPITQAYVIVEYFDGTYWVYYSQGITNNHGEYLVLLSLDTSIPLRISLLETSFTTPLTFEYKITQNLLIFALNPSPVFTWQENPLYLGSIQTINQENVQGISATITIASLDGTFNQTILSMSNENGELYLNLLNPLNPGLYTIMLTTIPNPLFSSTSIMTNITITTITASINLPNKVYLTPQGIIIHGWLSTHNTFVSFNGLSLSYSLNHTSQFFNGNLQVNETGQFTITVLGTNLIGNITLYLQNTNTTYFTIPSLSQAITVKHETHIELQSNHVDYYYADNMTIQGSLLSATFTNFTGYQVYLIRSTHYDYSKLITKASIQEDGAFTLVVTNPLKPAILYEDFLVFFNGTSILETSTATIRVFFHSEPTSIITTPIQGNYYDNINHSIMVVDDENDPVPQGVIEYRVLAENGTELFNGTLTITNGNAQFITRVTLPIGTYYVELNYHDNEILELKYQRSFTIITYTVQDQQLLVTPITPIEQPYNTTHQLQFIISNTNNQTIPGITGILNINHQQFVNQTAQNGVITFILPNYLPQNYTIQLVITETPYYNTTIYQDNLVITKLHYEQPLTVINAYPNELLTILLQDPENATYTIIILNQSQVLYSFTTQIMKNGSVITLPITLTPGTYQVVLNRTETRRYQESTYYLTLHVHKPLVQIMFTPLQQHLNLTITGNITPVNTTLNTPLTGTILLIINGTITLQDHLILNSTMFTFTHTTQNQTGWITITIIYSGNSYYNSSITIGVFHLTSYYLGPTQSSTTAFSKNTLSFTTITTFVLQNIDLILIPLGTGIYYVGKKVNPK